MDNTSPPASAETPHRKRPKVPPFARYEGTSAWRKDRRRVKAYNLFRAAEKRKDAQRAEGRLGGPSRSPQTPRRLLKRGPIGDGGSGGGAPSPQL